MVTLNQLAKNLDAELRGDGSVDITGVASLEKAGAGQIAPAAAERFRERAMATQAAALLVPPALADVSSDTPRLIHPHPLVALNRIVEHLGMTEARPAPGIHPTAVVDESAELSSDCYVGPYVVIEAGVRVGKRCVLQARGFLGHGVVMGDDCLLQPGVVLHPKVELKNRVYVGANSVIGGDGFGWTLSPTGMQHLHHIGRVIVEDDVRIHAACTIDRARFDVTRIGARSGLDNQVHVGHNSAIGTDCYVAAQAGFGGRSAIGDRSMIGGQAGFALGGGVGIDSQVGAQSGVIKLFGDKADLWGSPARDRRTNFKMWAAMRRLLRE
ncbi:MAG: UDP-3-O-(3-hydroxymyristoyl)glucosamine N-acyltransferase [Planctomycetota bacterium]|nr:UDP-3-O-(3-hydroxymyristoyl)glucosamine N-acyltransferase [Planctomycetota bacterium]